jgi:G3E family GTPase
MRINDLPSLDCIVTVVDALRMASEFGCGESLQKSDLDEEDIENLLIEQIEFCNIILLNKISEVSADEAAHIKAIIRAIQPKAEIIECDYAEVDMDKLINTHMFDFEEVATSATWVKELEGNADDDDDDDHDHHHHDDDDDDDDDHDEHHHHEHHHDHEHHHHHDHDHEEGEAEEYGIGTFVYFRREPLNFEKFDRFLAKNWPKSVIRTKGVIYFSQNKDMSILFEQAGVQKNVKEAGYWYATAPKEELEKFLAQDAGLRRDWDPVYGDRMLKIVFIGRNMDRKAITAALDECLETR